MTFLIMIILVMMVTAMMMMMMMMITITIYQTNVSLHLKREMRLKIMFAGKRQAPDSS